VNFKTFLFIVVGMAFVGISIGYVFGFYVNEISSNIYWAYLAAPLLGIGSGMIIYGILFTRNN
jgi:hypothetical protein